ncbi:MAG: hypothetical protein H7X71_06235 [Chitinophagales bacterium]|nr:hypothetical protein [Chitinophagales bacterium]
MEVNDFDFPELYKLEAEIFRVGKLAVEDARAENKRLGLPNVIGRDGKVYYEYADGRIEQIFPKTENNK